MYLLFKSGAATRALVYILILGSRRYCIPLQKLIDDTLVACQNITKWRAVKKAITVLLKGLKLTDAMHFHVAIEQNY